jgi:hypothetical protein
LDQPAGDGVVGETTLDRILRFVVFMCHGWIRNTAVNARVTVEDLRCPCCGTAAHSGTGFCRVPKDMSLPDFAQYDTSTIVFEFISFVAGLYCRFIVKLFSELVFMCTIHGKSSGCCARLPTRQSTSEICCTPSVGSEGQYSRDCRTLVEDMGMFAKL